MLVQLFIIYFGLGQIEYLRSSFLLTVLKEPYWCAIIAFALNKWRIHIRDTKICF